ncbi:penicillin-binding protein activator [Thermodesulfobacteriota bacterium]
MKVCELLVLTAALFFFACAPQPIKPPSVPPAPPVPTTPTIPPVAVPKDTGEELFLWAQKMYAEKAYPTALKSYNQYLSSFPEGPYADKALMRSATIYMTMAKYTEARNAYTRLIAQHPESPFVADARIEMLFTYYYEGSYNDVIRQASAIKEDTVSKIQVVRMYQLLGDTYLAMESYVDATDFYTKAYHQSEKPAKEKIIPLIKEAIRKLDTSGILTLLGSLEDKTPTDYLMFQLGQNKAREKNYDAAIAVLSAFIEKFPEHENTSQAKFLLEELIKNYQYNRYTIGCLLPLSGPYKVYGQRALKAIELALVQFTSQTHNPDIKTIIKDTGSDPDKAAQGVRELFKENVAAIIGPLTAIEPAALEAQDKGIPIITLTQKDYIPEIGEFVFRNFFTPQMQVKTLVSYAVKELGLTRFAILYPDEHYGKTFMNLFWDEAIAQGGSVVGVESYSVSQMDFADPIKKLVGLYYEVPEALQDKINLIAEKLVNVVVKEGEDDLSQKKSPADEEPPAIVDFDAVFIPDAPKKAGLIIPQLAFYDVKDVYLFGTNLWNSEDLIKMAREYVQNAIIPAGFFADSASEQVGYFVKGFKETFGAKPGFIEAVSYDTAMILFQLTNRADIRSRTALKDALINLNNYQGVTGLTSFETNGDVHKKLYLLRIHGNKFIELEYH